VPQTHEPVQPWPSLRFEKKLWFAICIRKSTVRMLSPAGSSRNDDATIRSRVSGGCLHPADWSSVSRRLTAWHPRPDGSIIISRRSGGAQHPHDTSVNISINKNLQLVQKGALEHSPLTATLTKKRIQIILTLYLLSKAQQWIGTEIALARNLWKIKHLLKSTLIQKKHAHLLIKSARIHVCLRQTFHYSDSSKKLF